MSRKKKTEPKEEYENHMEYSERYLHATLVPCSHGGARLLRHVYRIFLEYVNDLLKNNEKKQYKSERKLWDAARCFRVFLMPGMFSCRNHGTILIREVNL